MKLDVLQSLNAERAARRAVVVVTDVASGEQRLVKAADVAKDPLKGSIEKRLRMAKSGMEETPHGRVFFDRARAVAAACDHGRRAYQSNAGAGWTIARL